MPLFELPVGWAVKLLDVERRLQNAESPSALADVHRLVADYSVNPSAKEDIRRLVVQTFPSSFDVEVHEETRVRRRIGAVEDREIVWRITVRAPSGYVDARSYVALDLFALPEKLRDWWSQVPEKHRGILSCWEWLRNPQVSL